MPQRTCISSRGDRHSLGIIQESELVSIPMLLEESKKAFAQRSTTPIAQRIEYIQSFLDDYKTQKTSIAHTMSIEMGKPITQALADIDYDIGYIQRHIEHTTEIISPKTVYQDDTSMHTLYYEPKGVAGVISPRNYPTSQLVREVIPPLLAGNTILYKPASACARTAQIVCQLLQKHLPAHVFQALYGSGSLGQALVENATDMIIFTGSTSVGKQIQISSATQQKPCHLELGGSAPGIILPDATIDTKMMQTIEHFRVWHAGQVCDGLKRLFVHNTRYEELMQVISDYFGSIRIGNPLDSETKLGPLISQQAYDTVQQQVQQSSEGKKIIQLGSYDGTPGPFMPFTLIINPDTHSPVMQEEVFGPVLPIITYNTLQEAVDGANNTPYGLGAYVRGKDMQTIDQVCGLLKTGNINVNNTNYVIPQVPFGGYKPASGNYREHGGIGLRQYTEIKVISKPLDHD